MFRYVALFLVAASVAGCDINFSSLRPVKWATVDVGKVREAVKEGVVAENPYPAELKEADVTGEEYTRTRNQIANLKAAASEKCKTLHLTSDGRAAARHPEIMPREPQIQLGSGYMACLQHVDNDQLISDLNLKLEGYNKLRQLRSAHDREVARKIEMRAKDVVSAYGKSNGYDLLIEARVIGVVYNSSDLVADVTSGVLESLKR